MIVNGARSGSCRHTAGTACRTAAGLPSPELTSTGRFRVDKAPEVLAATLALLAVPPPAYLIGVCPAGQANQFRTWCRSG
jgi:hypothetical protein